MLPSWTIVKAQMEEFLRRFLSDEDAVEQVILDDFDDGGCRIRVDAYVAEQITITCEAQNKGRGVHTYNKTTYTITEKELDKLYDGHVETFARTACRLATLVLACAKHTLALVNAG